jgi:hypothetical protein
MIEVCGDRKLAGAQAVGTGLGGASLQGPDLGQGLIAPHDEEGLPRLDTAEK